MQLISYFFFTAARNSIDNIYNHWKDTTLSWFQRLSNSCNDTETGLSFLNSLGQKTRTQMVNTT